LHDRNSAASAVDPDGLTDPGYHQYNVPGLPDANTVALIGSIAQEKPYLLVGTGTTYECPGDGTLFLGINDVGVDNNSGEFSATITQLGQGAQGDEAQGRTLEIPSTQVWTDTHVRCRAGDVLDITGSGTVLHEAGNPASAVDPTGLTDPGF